MGGKAAGSIFGRSDVGVGVSISSSVDRCRDDVSRSSESCLDGGDNGGECVRVGNAGVGGMVK